MRRFATVIAALTCCAPFLAVTPASADPPYATQMGIGSSVGGSSFSCMPDTPCPWSRSGEPVSFGVTYYATPIGSAGTLVPTGTVVFLDGGAPIGSAQLAADGTAWFTTRALAVGSHTITAVWAGDGNFAAPSNTSAVFHQVRQALPGSLIGPARTTQVITDLPLDSVATLVNLTMTGAFSSGYLTADACSQLHAGPQSNSNGNFTRGQNIANLAVVSKDMDTVCLWASQPVQAIVDVQGYFSAGPGLLLTTTPPSRVLDTRSGAKPAAGLITHVATSAPAGTVAVLANLTMTDADTTGYITADKCSAVNPGPQTESNGNYAAGQNIANLAVVPVDPDGSFCIYTETPVHLLADIQGTFSTTGSYTFTAVSPKRVFDSRVSG